MPKFVLAQPSLDRVGGHYYDFAMHVLPVVEAAGYEPVLATHLTFRTSGELPESWRVSPVFSQCEAYMRPPKRQWVRDGQTGFFVSRLAALHDWTAAQLRAARWKRRTRNFQRACRALFDDLSLSAGDQVMLASAGDLDLAGLAPYLRNEAWTRDVKWHFLFHYSVFTGREPDYARQSQRLNSLREHLRRVLHGLEKHSLHFYATTPRLAAQFNRLGVAEFCFLPYPVNPAFQSSASTRSPNQRLRILCAGELRREKGLQKVAELIDLLGPTHLASGEVQLMIQAGGRQREEIVRLAGANQVDACRDLTSALESTAPVVLVPHPLSGDEYARLIHSADIGLCLHDAVQYYARYSGVLMEMLCNGLPTIVPAGCWLADQLFESNQRHLQRVERQADSLSMGRLDDIRWQYFTAGAKEILAARGPAGAAVGELPVPPGAGGIIVTFDTDAPEPGSWLRVAAEQPGTSRRHVHILPTNDSPARVFVPLAEHGDLRLQFSNAYHSTPLSISNLKFRFLASATGNRPAGAAGCIAADTAQIPGLVDDLIANYAHYRQNAADLAPSWRQVYSPAAAIHMLLSNAGEKSPTTRAA